MQEIHIGNLIRDKLKEKDRSASWLAGRISCDRSNICKILRKTTIDTALLLQISMALETNFFMYYSDIYFDMIKNADKPDL